MKKYIISILVTSIFLLGIPFAMNQVSAQNMSIRDFVNLLVVIGVITSEKIPVVNAYLETLDKNDEALVFMNQLKKDLGLTQEIIKNNKSLTFEYGSNCLGRDNLNGYMFKGLNFNISSYGFITDSYNSGDATLSGALAQKKGKILCQSIHYSDTQEKDEFFCTDLSHISKDKFKENCENRG
jgi:hypothetical protein